MLPRERIKNTSYRLALWSWYSPFSRLHEEPFVRGTIDQISLPKLPPRVRDAESTSLIESLCRSPHRRRLGWVPVRAAFLRPPEWRRGRREVQSLLLHRVFCLFFVFLFASNPYTYTVGGCVALVCWFLELKGSSFSLSPTSPVEGSCPAVQHHRWWTALCGTET